MNHLHQELPGAPALAGMNTAPPGRTIGRVGIIGANAVGLGVATSLLDAGVPVTLLECERASLDSGIEQARSAYRAAVAKGELGPDEQERRMALLAGTVYFHHLKDCDLIVDAMQTDTPGREKLFRRLDQVAMPGAVLVTHAGNAGVDHIAGCTRRRGEVLGLQLAGTPDAGDTWRIVRGKDTSSATLDTVLALARKLRKTVAVCDGPGALQ